MSQLLRPPAYLAAAARYELEVREAHYPKQIAEGAIATAEAEADLAAWRAIAGLMEMGAVETKHTFADLEAVAEAALQRRVVAAAQKPDKRSLAHRRDLVAAIRDKLGRQRQFIEDLNRDLRARAGKMAA